LVKAVRSFRRNDRDQKMFFYLLSWHWDAKENPIADNINSQQLILKSNGIKLIGTKELIKQKDVDMSH
jgi:hypothetical protein